MFVKILVVMMFVGLVGFLLFRSSCEEEGPVPVPESNIEQRIDALEAFRDSVRSALQELTSDSEVSSGSLCEQCVSCEQQEEPEQRCALTATTLPPYVPACSVRCLDLHGDVILDRVVRR